VPTEKAFAPSIKFVEAAEMLMLEAAMDVVPAIEDALQMAKPVVVMLLLLLLLLLLLPLLVPSATLPSSAKPWEAATDATVVVE